jgi:PAS domain S-box-containing protein
METKWLPQLVERTGDAAFAVDASGRISAWNLAAEELFGFSSPEVIDRPCHEILQGSHESGPFCSKHCSIHQALQMNKPVANFDLRLQTKTGKEWCNLTIIEILAAPESGERHSMHLVRRLDPHKLIEQLARVMTPGLGMGESEAAAKLVSKSLANVPEVKLTTREKEILRLLADGKRTRAIADQLYISRSTVNNHIQHIIEKLDSHSRLEVVVRAREAGII